MLAIVSKSDKCLYQQTLFALKVREGLMSEGVCKSAGVLSSRFIRHDRLLDVAAATDVSEAGRQGQRRDSVSLRDAL